MHLMARPDWPGDAVTKVDAPNGPYHHFLPYAAIYPHVTLAAW